MKNDAAMWQASTQIFYYYYFQEVQYGWSYRCSSEEIFFQQYLIPSLRCYLIELIDILGKLFLRLPMTAVAVHLKSDQ